MEGCGPKRLMVSFVVLMMVVLAQGLGRGADLSPDHYFPNRQSTGYCASKCALKCAFRIFPPSRFTLCFGLCMVSCKLQPSQVVNDCTSDCAYSMVNAYNPTAEEAENFVGSCYQICKNNNKN